MHSKDLNSPASRGPAGDATLLLQQIRSGAEGAENQLYQMLQGELRSLACDQLNGHANHHTLQPTALINEAWMRLAKAGGAPAQDRAHFLAVATRAMRTALVDHARHKSAVKRDPGGRREPLEQALDHTLKVCNERGFDAVELDDALERLARDKPRQAKLVELRFFGGLTHQEAAEVLGISLATAARDWELARHWLLWELGLAE